MSKYYHDVGDEKRGILTQFHLGELEAAVSSVCQRLITPQRLGSRILHAGAFPAREGHAADITLQFPFRRSPCTITHTHMLE